jgi:hypothetical protein
MTITYRRKQVNGIVLDNVQWRLWHWECWTFELHYQGMVLIWFGLIHMQSKCRNKKVKSEVQICSFLTSTLDRHERFPSLLTPGQGTQGTYSIGGWWAPEPVWTFWRRRKKYFPPVRHHTPHHPAKSLVTIRNMLPWLLQVHNKRHV